MQPRVDINLFVYNGAATIAEALDSVLAQTWRNIAVTVIDNASDDGTCAIVEGFAAADTRVRLHRNAANVGPVQNCQRAFTFGDADFVMPKTADDLLAPDFIEAVMEVLLSRPEVAMCHAAGVVFGDDRRINAVYPASHHLHAIEDSPLARARTVMAHYTSAPSFWGIYRRSAAELLAPLAYRPGWDHAVLAELALYGHITHVPEQCFWRRHGGKAVDLLARGCSQFTQRGLPHDDDIADLFWALPLIGTAYAHVERFALARAPRGLRAALMDEVGPVFRTRWLPALRREAAGLRRLLAARTGGAAGIGLWQARQIATALDAVQAILPDEDFSAERYALLAPEDAYSS